MPVPLNPQPTNINQDTIKQRRQQNANQGVKSKKEATTPSLPSPAVTPENNDLRNQQQQSHMKRLSRKGSKPIINWFQRKLAGTVRPRRASDGDGLRSQRIPNTRPPIPIPKDKQRRLSVPSPVPSGPARQRSLHKGTAAGNNSATSKRNTIALDGDDDFTSLGDTNSVGGPRTSSVLESTWSPNSVYEADDDASVRPIPPSAPPSPSPSLSSSSYLSDPRTFASMAVSTKPTTLLSVDMTGGMAHIAQAPPTPTTPAHRIPPHLRTHSAGPGSGGSITFSVLPPIATASRPSSTNHAHGSSISSQGPSNGMTLQAPLHTSHHPRNNPRPSSPPLDNASLFTLASSAFGMPGGRVGVASLALSGRTSIADDSISHFSHPIGISDSTSHFVLGDGDGDADEDRLPYGDVDASVRALRPRSSRRGSWDSEASGWSARVGGAQNASILGTPSVPRERGLWATESYRYGDRATSGDTETENGSMNRAEDMARDTVSFDNTDSLPSAASTVGNDQESIVQVEPSSSPSSPLIPNGTTTPKDKALETPKVTTIPLDGDVPEVPPPTVRPSPAHLNVAAYNYDRDDSRSLATTTDGQTDVFVSAPSTPMA